MEGREAGKGRAGGQQSGQGKGGVAPLPPPSLPLNQATARGRAQHHQAHARVGVPVSSVSPLSLPPLK